MLEPTSEGPIKIGDTFIFETYGEAYTFLMGNSHRCDVGVILTIPGSSTNQVHAIGVRGVNNAHNEH